MNATLESRPPAQAPSNLVPLSVDRLGKRFGPKKVLDGVSLRVEPGEVLGLLGKNGAGKSTLIKCMLGLLKPTSGEAAVFGESPWDLSAETKARIGYVPQELVAYPWMRVRHVIAYTAAFYPTWNQSLADELCDRWDVPLDDRAGVLSLGQLQTLGLVLALGYEPDLLVLDEPVASLDPLARRQFLRTLIDIVDESRTGRRRSVLFSTHITSDLERIADRVALLRGGRIELDGSLDELKDAVKRVRLTRRSSDFDPRFTLRGGHRSLVEGRIAEATLTDFAPELVGRLAAEHDADVEVIDLNLEELFVDLHEA